MSVRTVSVKLLAEISGYVSPLKAAIQTTKDLRGELTKAAGEGKLDAVASTATKAGLALTGGFLLATGAAARFEQAMSQVNAVAGASATEMQALSDAALKAGADTQYSATEAAKAEAELAKAGLSASDILGGALTGSLSLAAAGSLDLGEAADTAAKAMNIFGLDGGDVGHIADVLAAAANKSATDVHELAFALKMGGLAAKNSGVSLEETVGTFAAFADNALVGSDAGTSFKQMLMMLAAPTEKATALMDELGIKAYDAQGNFVGIAGLADILQDKLGGLTQEQRNQALATIFGADAMRAATVLFNEGAAGIREYTAAVNDEGAAQDAAAKKTDNLMGDIERLTGSLETLFIQAGSGSNSGLRVLVQGLGELVNLIGALPSPVLSVGTVLIGLAGAALLAASAFVKVRSTARETMDELRAAGPVAERFASGLERTTRFATRASAALAVLASAGVVLSEMTKHEVDIEGLNESIARLGKTGQVTGELTRLFGNNLEDAYGDAAAATAGVSGFARGVEELVPLLRPLNEAMGVGWNEAADKFKAVDDALAGMVRSGNVDEARAAFVRLMQASHLSLDEMTQLLPQYINATTEAERTTDQQAEAAAVAKEANVNLAGAFGEAASEADGLKTAFDALNGAELNWRDAERDAEAAVDDLIESLVKSHGSLDVHTEKGRAAAQAVDDLASAAAVAAQKKMDETGSVEQANAVYQLYIGQLRGALTQAGLTKAEIDKLITSIASMPTTKTVTITYRIDAHARDHVLAELDRVTGMRYGGVRHAETGLLRQATAFSAGSSPLYAFAESGTGGEAFVPRNGQYSRSMGILNTAAGWYGAQVVPRDQGWYGSSGGAGARGHVDVKVTVADPRGRVLHESLTTYAVDTGRAPSDLWSNKRR